MKPLFTPGPWCWDGPYTLRPVDRSPDSQYVHTILTVQNVGYGYFGCENLRSILAESDANQHLIAAAPDLYDAACAAAKALSTGRILRRPTDPKSIALAKLLDAIGKANCSTPLQFFEDAA